MLRKGGYCHCADKKESEKVFVDCTLQIDLEKESRSRQALTVHRNVQKLSCRQGSSVQFWG